MVALSTTWLLLTWDVVDEEAALVVVGGCRAEEAEGCEERYEGGGSHYVL